MALASESSDRFRPKVLIPKLGHTESLELENLGSSWFIAGALVDDSNRGGAELLSSRDVLLIDAHCPV
jgi:hypothetical protein